MKDENKTLPSWFKKPDPDILRQICIFNFNPKLNEISIEYQVSIDEMKRWHDKGWLSFSPDEKEEINDPDLFEIRFVRDVVRSGLSDACVEKLFSQLSKPYSYNPDRIAYSFSLGWVEYTESYEEIDYAEVIEDHLEEWLDEISEEEDQGKLNNLIALIDNITNRTNGNNPAKS
jgi:hypothetical protein